MSRRTGDRARDISTTLSYWLRHKPEAAGLAVDGGGWADVSAVLTALAPRFRPPVTAEELAEVVAGSDKGRFSLRADRVRAVQGHSFPVDLGLDVSAPPDTLFHGTTDQRWQTIRRDGLRPMRRQYVHLSPDRPAAERVARRHRGEEPLILRVRAAAAAAAGHPFYLAENGVWLTDAVPPAFLTPMQPKYPHPQPLSLLSNASGSCLRLIGERGVHGSVGEGALAFGGFDLNRLIRCSAQCSFPDRMRPSPQLAVGASRRRWAGREGWRPKRAG